MIVMKIIIGIAVVILIGEVGERFLKKRFQIEKKPGFFYKPVNNIHRAGEWILLGLFLIVIILDSVYEWTGDEGFPILLFGLLTVIHAFRAFMEWKYDKVSKLYITSIYGSVLLVVLFLILLEGSLVSWLLG